jgi:DNA-binding NarL/FixJ family response regulator
MQFATRISMPTVNAGNRTDHNQPEAGTGSHPTAPLVVLLVSKGEVASSATWQLLIDDGDIRAIHHGRESSREAGGVASSPDVVLLDVDARDDGAEAAVRDAVAKWRPAPVLVLTDCEDRPLNRRLVRSGARGVVTRSRQDEQLLSALHRVHDGEIWLGRSCMSQLIDEMAAASRPPAHLATAEGLERLTERERDVVALIAQGMHNKAIAGELGITDHTVRHHLTAIFAKLGVADRLELAVYAFRHRNAGRRS